MIRDPATWLANATVPQILAATFWAAAGLGALIGIAVYWYRHREEE